MPRTIFTQNDNTRADAVFRIDAIFREYRPGEFCEYEINPVSRAQKGWDNKKRPIWRLGEDPAKPDVSLHVGHYQKPDTLRDVNPANHQPTTIRLEPEKGRGRFRLNIVVRNRWDPAAHKPVDTDSSYHPVGLVFLRADQTDGRTGKLLEVLPDYAQGNPSAGIPYVTGRYPDGPFENVEINGADNYVLFEMVRTRRTPPLETDPDVDTHRTYRIWIIIQEATTGKIGIIDPEGEDPNAQV